jgi:UDP-N-acetylmuramoyl-L-alanyl-D-glutamate--2,6-diaminopimelate ligase
VRLATLLAAAAPGAACPDDGIEVGGISGDSRNVRPGDLFVALRGGKADGHDFLDAAARAGASAALVDRDVPSPPLPLVRVAVTADALPPRAGAVHGDPSAKIRVTGVTGTNGKTTVTYLRGPPRGRAHPAVIERSTTARGSAPADGPTTPFPTSRRR